MAYAGEELYLHAALSLPLVGVGWSLSCQARFTLQKANDTEFECLPGLAWAPRKSHVTYLLSLTGVGTRTLGRPAVFVSVR